MKTWLFWSLITSKPHQLLCLLSSHQIHAYCFTVFSLVGGGSSVFLPNPFGVALISSVQLKHLLRESETETGRQRERENGRPKIQSSCGQRQQNLPWPPPEPRLRLHQDRVWFHMFGLKLVKLQSYTRRLHGYHVQWSKITHTKRPVPGFLPHRHENRSCLSRRYFSLQFATTRSLTMVTWKAFNTQQNPQHGGCSKGNGIAVQNIIPCQ